MSLSVGKIVTIEKSLRFASPNSKTRSRASRFALLPLAFAVSLSSQTNAGPEGGEVINGAGSINRDGNTTTIHQETDRMTIDWQSYDVNTNERVNYIQPDSSSLSLNRILSDRGSQILGRIDANGHVILMNPNGIIFGKDAVVNAGGLLASGLSIDPADFLNGDFTFSALENTEGSVINRGLLNASTGGSISLLGKRVENDGLISADLGQINLAAGEGAVVTFDNEGLLGLRVTEAILQDDLGVDPAVVNSGEVSAENGQILITASVSEDIFSEAVNNGALNLESSVVVHEDGTFTLGEGADVVNTGSVSVSGENSAGEIVVLGENITSSGDVSANTTGDSNNTAGSIEIHSNDTTLLTEQSTTTAVAENSGQGGDVKVLGNTVGLAHEALVDSSGASGGGQVLIGGDVTGANEKVRNAEFIYLGENTEVNANALDQGDGGKLITFAGNTAFILGQLNAVGGKNGGDGGFVETSGFLGFHILNAPQIFAYDGMAGEWLIDPIDVHIRDSVEGVFSINGPIDQGIDDLFASYRYDPAIGVWVARYQLDDDLLRNTFQQGGTVTITTSSISADTPPDALNGDIIFFTDLNYSTCTECTTTSTPTLVLDASRNVDFNGFDITNGGNSSRSLNLQIGSSSDRVSSVTNSSATTSNIVLNGGDFTSYSSGAFSGENVDINAGGGDITIDSSGSSIALLNATTVTGRIDFDSVGSIGISGRVTSDDIRLTSSGGDVLLNEVRSDRILLRADRDIVVQDGDDFQVWVVDAGRDLDLTANRIVSLGADFLVAGNADITANGVSQTGDVSLAIGLTNFNNLDLSASGDVSIRDYQGGINLGNIDIDGDLALISTDGNIADLSGASVFVAGTATFTSGTINNGYFDVLLDSLSNDFNRVEILDGDNASFYDINSIELLDINLGAVGPQELVVNTRGDILGTGEVFAQRATFDTNGLGGVSLTNPDNYLDLLRVGSSANPVSSLEYSDWAGVSLWSGVYVSGDVHLNTGTSTPTRVSTNAGDVVVGGNFTVSSNGADVDLRSSDNVTIGGAASFINAGNVELQETDSVVLGASSVSGDLIVESGGNVGQVGVVSVGNITDISAPGSNVTLDNASNDFEFVALLANNAVITDQDNVNLYGVNVDAFTLNAGGDVLDVDSTSTIVSGVAVIDVGSTNDIYLNAPGTDFNDLSILSANNATVIDVNSIDLGSVSVGVLNVTASEEITDSASITAETAYFNAGGDAYDITLNNSSNDFNFISVNGAYRAEVRDVDSVSLFDTAVTILDVYSNGPITDAGPLLISGAARFNPGFGNFVRVDDTGNDFNFVRIGTSSNSASTASIRDINEITLARTYVQGSFTVFSNGHITDAASQVVGESINVGGLAYFSAGSANDVILDYGHDFSTIRFASVRDAELVSDGSVAIGVSTIGRNLDVSFVHDDSFSVLLDAGAIDVAGVTTVDARSVILDDDHDFNTVEINTSTGSVTLNDVDNVVFGDSSIGSTLNVTTNGSITDTGVLNVVGNSSFSAGSANNITLDSASNDFGQVSVGSANTVSLVDSNALVLGDITVSGDLDLTVGGGLTDSSAVIIGGGLTLDSTGGGINLSSSYHQITGVVNINQSGAPAPFELWVQNANLGTVVTNSDSVATINIQGDFTSGAASITVNGAGEFEIVGDASSNIFTFDSGFSFTGSRLYVDGADSADTFNLNTSAPFVLAGGEGDDQFNLANGITFDLIDGNGGLSDTLDYSAWTSDVVVDLESVDVDVITGSLSNSNNTLMGSDVDSAFNITAQNDGDVDGVIAFTDFNNITGGTGADTFTFGPTGEITGILDGGTGAGSNTIEARGGVDNTFIVSGENSGSLQETAGATYVPGFQNVQNLTGGDQSDTFSIQDNASVDGTINGNGGANSLSYALQSGQVIVDLAGGVSGALDIQNIIGNGSDSRLIGDDNNNTWVIDGADEGSVDGINFEAFNNVQGGDGDNTFTIQSGGSISGEIRGGSAGGADSLNALPGDNSWNITGTNVGDLQVSGGATYVASFIEVEMLNGQAGVDTFSFADGASFAGTINGGTGVAEDELNFSLQPSVDVDLTSLNVSNIEAVRGNGTDSTISGDAAGNTWVISGADQGSVNSGTGFNFYDFNNIAGGTGDDVFDFSSGGSLTGTLDGGLAGSDEIIGRTEGVDWILNSANGGSADLSTGGTFINVFTDIEELSGQVGMDTLEAFDQTNAWALNDPNSGTINVSELTFTGMENLTGGSGDDTFNFNFSGLFSGAVDAGADVDGDIVNVEILGAGYDLTLGDAINGVTNAETVIAATGSTLNGLDAATNNWNVSGDNIGSVSSGGTSLNFEGFSTLEGSDAVADVLVIDDGASFIGSFNAGTDTAQNSFTNNNDANTWTLSAANDGDVGTTSFTNVSTIYGSGNDTLEAFLQANDWVIESVGAGYINAHEVDFSGMENISGNSLVDSFVLNVNNGISGSIDGGSGGVQDTLEIQSSNAVSVEIGNGVLGQINVVNIENIIRPVANAADSYLYHSLATSAADSYTWTIDGANSGNVIPTSGANTDNTIVFSNFGNLTGGQGEDLIDVVGAGRLDGVFDPGTGPSILRLTYDPNNPEFQPIDITIGETYLDIDGVAVNPGAGFDVEDIEATLRANSLDTTANNWTIDGVNSGSVDTDGDAEADFVFINFNHLFGGSGDDTFNFDYSVVDISDPANYEYASITGQIVGLGGVNTIEYVGGLDSAADPSLITPIFQFDGIGSAITDSTITSLGNVFEVNARPEILATIVGSNSENNWTINLVGGGTISGGFVFTGFDNLEGNAGDDSFVLAGGTVVSVDGQGGSDTLVADSRANTFDITGLNSGVLNSADANGGTSFSNVENLTGDNAADNFVIGAGGQLDGTIDGSTGTDTITGNDSFNSWTIETDNSGSLTGIDGFEEIENLVGGAGDDTFNFNNDAVVSNITLNTGNNIVNITSRTSAVNVDLNTGAVGGVNVTDVANMSGVNANDAHSNTLVSVVQDNAWTISEINGGDVSGIDFSGFHNLQGSTGVDSFVFAGGYVEGDIDGGSGTAQDTITADDATNSWQVTADNSGTLNAETSFADVEVLNGGSGTDNFVIGDGNSVDEINGGLGSNTIDLTAWSSDISADLDQSTVASIQFTSIGRIDANTSNNNTFQGGVGSQAWVLTPADSSVGGFTFSGFQNIVGSPLVDDVTLQGGTFAGNFDGLGGSDILRGNNESSDWEITGIDSGNLNSNLFNFTGIANLVGNNQDDTFTLNGGSISGSINGGAGVDEINALTGNNTWNITSSNSGDATNVNTFSAVERLVGGDALDRFVVSDGATIDAIDGGAGASDVLDITAFTFDAVADMDAGVVAGLPFTQIEVIEASDTQNNTFIAPTGDNAWDISALNAGTLNGVLQFTGFQNLLGNSGADDFVLNGVISGDVDGAGGVNSLTGDATNNTWTIQSVNAGVVDGVGSFSNIQNLTGSTLADDFVLQAGASIESIDGAAGSDSLTIESGITTWSVTSTNTGTATNVAAFTGVENLIGGSGEDTFVIADGASVATLDGAAGPNEIDLRALTSDIVVDLESGVMAGLQTANIEVVRANATQSNTILGSNQDNIWTLSTANNGGVTGVESVLFAGFENIVGNAQADDLVLSGGTLSGQFDGLGGANSVTANNQENTWLITSINAGSVDGLSSFVNVDTLNGNDQADTFILQGGSISGSINAGAGDDQIQADEFANTWTITGVNSGQVTGLANFDSVETVVGGSFADTFVFSDAARVDNVDGGTDGIDVMNLDAYTTSVEYNLALGTVAGMSVSNIDSVVVDNGLDNTLFGANQVNSWQITGANSGDLNGSSFSGFANLTGGTDVDTFELAGGSLSGVIDGNFGSDVLLGSSGADAFVVTSANAGDLTGTGGFQSVENLGGNAGNDTFEIVGGSLAGTINGGTGTDTFTAADANNAWQIDVSNGGVVNGVARFDEVENLVGNSQVDSFAFVGGSLSGGIDGSGGNDEISADASISNTFVITDLNEGTATNIGTTFTGVESINGGDQADNFTLAGGTLSGTIDGGFGVDTFIADNVATEFYIYSANSGSVTGLGAGTADPNDGFVSIENLEGNAQDDRFVFVDATLDGYIDGQDGMDLLVAAAGDNQFDITLDNSGTATGITGGFQNVESIEGNTGDDTFVLNGGILFGTVDGRAGDNTLIADDVANNFVVNATNAGTATGLASGTAETDDGFVSIQNIVGNDQADTLTLSGGTLEGTFDGGDGMDTLVADNVENTFTVYTNDSGSATGLGAGTADPNDGFDNVENLVGSAQSDSFVLSGGVLMGTIDGAGGIDTFTANNTVNDFYVTALNYGTATGLGAGTVDSTDGFSNVETLIGNDQSDTFYLQGGTLDGEIIGGLGDDLLNADDVATTVVIDDANSGSMTGLTVGFAGIENILGNNQIDTFIVDGGSLTGFVFGGAEDDSLTVVSTTGQSITWTVDNENTGTVDSISGGFQSFESLIGSDGNDIFTIDGTDLVQVDIAAGAGSDVVNVNTVMSGSLQGEAGDDEFNIAADVLLQNIEGGADNDTFNVLSDTASFDVVGGGGDDTLDVAHASDNNWIINGVDNRVQSVAGGTARFASTENLIGGEGVDTFDITAAITGSIFGEGNADIFNLSESVTGVIDAGSGEDTFNILDVAISAQLVSGTDEDTLQVFHDDANLWTINGVNNSLQDENAGLIGFSETEVLVGSVRIDTFDVTASFVGRLDGSSNDDVFNLAASVSDGDELTTDILGGAGNDTFNVTALNVNATIDGGTNNDTLIADHGFESTWIIDGIDDRVLDTTGGSQHFTSIEFGVGGDGSDTFQIGSAFNGRFDGRGGDDVFLIGADVDDGNTLTRDLLGGAGDDSFELATAGLFVSIDGGDDSDTLDVQFDDSILWTIDGANDRLNDSASGQTRFANIESSLGSSGVDTFNITSDVSGFINGRASNDIFNLSANVGTVVEGGADDDTFNINATGLTLNLDGGTGTDTIVTGHDTATTWTFDTINDRVEDGFGGVTTFVSAEFAQGGNDVDTFNVTRLYAGRIDGQGSNDIFNFEASVTDGNALTDDVLGGQGDDQFNINVTGISLAIDGGEGTADAVVATHAANNTWTFDGNSRVEDDLAGGATFSNVEVARGNDQIDQFIVSTDFNGQLDGQGGNDLFTLAANVSDGNVITSDVLGGAGDDVFSIELAGLQLSVDGGADADTLTVSHIDDSNWIIDGSNNRVEDASSGVVQFAGVETNQGGSGVDVFDIFAQVDGFIDGRGGNDTFNISADVLSVVRGGTGDDNFVINSTGLTLSVVGELGEDTLTTAYNSASTWTLDGVNNQVTEVNGGVTDFSGVENLVGGDAVDTFDITSFFQGTINGAANADIFNFSAGVSDNVLNTADVFGGSGDDAFNILAVGLTLDIDAQGGTDTLVGPESSNTWLIGSSNTLNGSIEFASVENFTGGTQVDNFIVEQGIQVNEIRGAADGATELGDDTLALVHAPSDAAVWRVIGDNQGSIDGQVAAFYSVENLTGGEGNDDFVFTNVAADISGLIDGGTSSDFFAPAEDTLRLDVMIDGVVVELGPMTASENLHVDNVETIIAAADPLPNDATDTEALNQLVNNETADYRWIIDGRNEGQLEPIVLPEEENTVSFENFGTLVAGLGEDSFLFEGEGNITGGIIGGSGNNTADYSNAAGNITITIGNGTGGGISGFTTIIGNNDGSAFDLPEATLQIANGENQWFVENTASDLTDGVNDGQFSDGSFGATDFTFVNFNNLSGGSDQDTFIVNGDATITGTLSGGANALANPDILNATNATQGIDVQVGGDDFTFINVVDIENIYANLALASSNTIYASDAEMNNWEINGVDAGRLNGATDFEGFANLEGTSGADTFVFDADDRISGLVNGAGGINDSADLAGLSDGTNITVDLSAEVDADLDVLNIVGVESITANSNDSNRVIGQDVNNVWLIDAANSGLVQRAENSSSDTTVALNNFAYLIGGSQNDEFIFDVNGTISGAILGGDVVAIDAFDSVDVTDLVTDVRVGLGESATADINIVDIELVFANGNTNNTLIADQMDNTWTISGSDIGDVNGTTNFENFANLEGRNANDTFVFTDQGRISGYIDAANENIGAADVVDMSALSIVDVTIGLGDTHVRNVEEIIGNNVDSTITVDELIAAQGNNWLIDGEENTGFVNGNIRFTGFNAISGSANDDVFTLQNSGAITGLISAQAGNDTLNVELSGEIPEVSFAGGEGDDRVIVDGDLGSHTGNYTPRTSTAYLANAEQLEYSNEDVSSVYTVSYTGVETLQDDVNASQFVINGSVEANVIRFAQEDQPGRNTFVVETLDAGGELLEIYADVNFSGKENLRVNADLIDTVEIAGDIDIANTVEIQGANVIVTNADAVVTSDHLALVNISGVASESNRLVTDVNTLAVSANDDVYIQEQNAIEVTEFDIANSAVFDIELVLAGDFTSTAAMQSNGDVRIQTNTGQISLTGDNQFGGELSLLATNAITLNNLSTTQLADVQAQTLNVISDAAIEDVDGASINVLDLAQLSSESDILLDGESHSFNRVAVSQSNSLNVVDSDGFGLIVEGVTANETASLTSNGMTISGDVNAQTIALDSGEGALQLNALLSTEGAGENFGAINMSAGAISQGADVVAQGDISIASSGQYQMADETRLTSIAGGVELTTEGAVNLQLVNAEQDISIASTNDTVTANAAITSTSGSISLSAFGDLILSDSLSSESGLSAISEMEDVVIDNILTVNEGELVVNAGQEIQMNAQSAIEVGSGTAELVAGSDISITSINVGGNGSIGSEGNLTDGQVTLDSTDGAIIDVNGDATNVVTHRLVMDASNGIANGGVVETSIDRVSAGNNGHDTSSVGILNDKTLIVERVHNNGDISVIVTDGDLLLDNTNYVAYDRSVVDANGMGGVEFTDANLAGGIVDANYEVGSVILRTNIGDIQVIEGNGSSTSRAQPVIAGRDIEVNTVLGQSGDFRTGRRLSIYANDRLVLRGKAASRPIFAFGVTPDIYRNLAEEQPDLASLLLESGDLLVEVESIEAVNPAVFSAVNNYSSDQTAILMPADQRYEGDDDEDELSY